MSLHDDNLGIALSLVGSIGLFASIYLARASTIARANFAIRFISVIAGLFLSILVMDYVDRILGAFLFLAGLWFLYFSMAQRMNDIGHSRWWVILTSSIFGIIILPMLMFFGSQNTNDCANTQNEIST